MREKMKRMYEEEGLSLRIIGEKVGIDRHKVSYMLKKMGVNVRNGKYNYNENYFRIIDTSEKAYWLGFLMADGYVSRYGRHVLELTLKEDDRDHVEKLRDVIAPDKPLYDKTSKVEGKTYKSVRLQVSNKQIVEDLKYHGCLPNKSKILDFPTTLPKEFMKDFIRGYFDGDGNIYIRPDKNVFRFSIMGTENFLKKLFEILDREISVSITKLCSDTRSDSNNTYTVYKGGINQTGKFLRWIYEDAEIYLSRKFKTYMQHYG